MLTKTRGVGKLYARNYENQSTGSYKSGEYNIPANYRGNAFNADISSEYEHPRNEPCEKCSDQDMCENTPEPQKIECSEHAPPKTGLLRSIISRFERGFELDDLILIALILLILQSGNGDSKIGKDETLLILGFLFLSGF